MMGDLNGWVGESGKVDAGKIKVMVLSEEEGLEYEVCVDGI